VFFQALRMIGYRRGLSMSELIREIEGHPRYRDQSLASALKVYAMEQMLPHYPLTAPPSPPANARAQTKRRAP
jgi:predicted DNA-binding ribbon-helix-helix protein